MIRRVEAIGIGCSTGGPDALYAVLPKLFGHINHAPVFITQHGAGDFTESLARELHRVSDLPVIIPKPFQEVRPGHVYFAPANFHLTVNRIKGQIFCNLDDGPVENYFKPSVDVMLRSISQIYKQSALALILTGMGKDGLEGCRSITENKGQVMIQDKLSSVVWGMPGAVSNAGLANYTVPLQLIPESIIKLLKNHP
jgi:two-component system chemotaxis response regulator CheB